MKFLALKHALEGFQVEPAQKPLETDPVPRTPFPLVQKVAADGISRDPINKQAALIIAKPPWWAYLITSFHEHTLRCEPGPNDSRKERRTQNQPNGAKPFALGRHLETRKRASHKATPKEKPACPTQHQTKQERLRQAACEFYASLKSLDDWIYKE